MDHLSILLFLYTIHPVRISKSGEKLSILMGNLSQWWPTPVHSGSIRKYLAIPRLYDRRFIKCYTCTVSGRIDGEPASLGLEAAGALPVYVSH